MDIEKGSAFQADEKGVRREDCDAPGLAKTGNKLRQKLMPPVRRVPLFIHSSPPKRRVCCISAKMLRTGCTARVKRAPA
jgi:hypothetical protein